MTVFTFDYLDVLVIRLTLKTYKRTENRFLAFNRNSFSIVSRHVTSVSIFTVIIDASLGYFQFQNLTNFFGLSS